MMIDSYIDWFYPYKQVLTQSDEKERKKTRVAIYILQQLIIIGYTNLRKPHSCRNQCNFTENKIKL